MVPLERESLPRELPSIVDASVIAVGFDAIMSESRSLLESTGAVAVETVEAGEEGGGDGTMASGAVVKDSSALDAKTTSFGGCSMAQVQSESGFLRFAAY